MDVQFSAPLMDASGFPTATIKAQPMLRADMFWSLPKRLSVNGVTTFRQTRYAIAAAAQLLKRSDRQNTVLLPAYHCPALIEPFLYCGFNVVFYPQLPDLSTDPAVFSSMLTSDITHVVVVRYFGFSQNADQLISLAAEASKPVIEDNAHSLSHFFKACERADKGIAACVSSVAKTLGTADGGLLYMPGFSLPLLQSANFLAEVKAIKSGYRHSSERQNEDTAQRYFKPQCENEAMLRSSNWIFKNSNYQQIEIRRRTNYQYLASKLSSVTCGALLYPQLLDDDVPYVVPFLLNDESSFKTLRLAGIQALRWEEVAVQSGAIALDYRRRLVQLPIHHMLEKTALDKIVEVLNDA